ncbi:MAG: HD domain-containing protein [Chloroflexi bacterium]|nr:MAG: HD domain-containing protein [Chloroflexota bacterium]
MDEARSEYSRVNLSSDPIYRYLRITKGGPGGVAGRAAEQDLVDAAWMQRLRRIHQLQSAWWVFATAEHSRFQHALGAMHLAGEWTRHLYPSLRVSCGDVPSAQLVEETMRIAGLLHDVGHGPFGHFFDENYLDTWGIDHEDIGRALIAGPLASRRPGWRSCAPRWSAPTRPTTWTMSRATPIYVASRRGRSMCSASFTTRSSPSAASRCTPTPRKRFTCSSTRVSTSITRSTSTAPCAGSTCSCARCFGRRSSSCSGATP